MRRLGLEEWAFWRVPKNELQICFDYELTREVVLQDRERQKRLSYLEVRDSPWLEDTVDELRSAAKESAQIIDFDGWIDHQVHLFIAMPYIIPVIYPEWPKSPYLIIDEEVRSDRSEKLTRPKETDEGCARFLMERRSGDTHITLSIPDWMTHKRLQAYFAGLLRSRFPEQGKRGKRNSHAGESAADPKVFEPNLYSQGRKASFDNIRDDLSALSVLRLETRGNSSRKEIINLLKRKDGKTPRYSREKALLKPMKRARENLDLCSDWAGVLDCWRERMLPLVLSDPHYVFKRIKEQIGQELSSLSSLPEIK